jgi:hypothetical protein
MRGADKEDLAAARSSVRIADGGSRLSAAANEHASSLTLYRTAIFCDIAAIVRRRTRLLLWVLCHEHRLHDGAQLYER